MVDSTTLCYIFVSRQRYLVVHSGRAEGGEVQLDNGDDVIKIVIL